MGNRGEIKSSLTLAEEATVGLLIALSEAGELPARPWPLVAACQVLAKRLPAASPYSAQRGLATDSVRGESVVAAWMLVLAEAGSVATRGQMADAAWIPAAGWIEGWKLAADNLPPDEAEAWIAAAQTLTRTLSIWRKASSAA
jgi:hypothetical protein